MLPGVRMRTVAWGEKSLLSEFLLAKGTVLPMHSHPHEQTGYMISGKMTFTIGEERFEALPGAAWCIPGGVVHGVEVAEDSVVVEAFCPLREEYLP